MAYIELVDRASIEESEAVNVGEDLEQETPRDVKQESAEEASDIDESGTVSKGDK